MTQQPAISPAMLAQRWGTSIHKILAFIDSGELPALNLALRRDGGKPRWKIKEEDIVAFESGRRMQPKPTPARRRKQKQEGVIEFF